MKKVVSAVVGVLLLASPFAQATMTHMVYPGFDVNMDFAPHESQELENPLWWSVDARCVFTMDIAPANAEGKALKKSATVDGKKLKEGQSMRMALNNNQTMKLKVDGSAKFRLTNLSDATVHAKCSV